jgi:hypothetical protein
MTLLAFSDCCDLLAITPKTLRNYLKRTGIRPTPHPTDRRIKCLTLAQVQHLAALRGRSLPKLSVPAPGFSDTIALSSAQPASSDNASRAVVETDLHLRLAQVEGQLLALQQQLASLTTGLLQRCELPGGPSLSSSVRSVDGRAASQPRSEAREPVFPSQPRWSPHPAESRRPAVLPLITYNTQDHYVIVCPQEGELSIMPDSSEWFAWLASLTSFRFVSKRGRFSARRDYDHGFKRSWSAHRVIHGRHYKHYLGTTDHLTIACLEQMAARLQAEEEMC